MGTLDNKAFCPNTYSGYLANRANPEWQQGGRAAGRPAALRINQRSHSLLATKLSEFVSSSVLSGRIAVLLASWIPWHSTNAYKQSHKWSCFAFSMVRREELTDEQWELIAPRIPEPPRRKDGRGRPSRDTREVMNGVLWILRSSTAVAAVIITTR
jgi:hypothetical protein